MTTGEFRTAINVAASVFVRGEFCMTSGPMAEEDMWFAFREFVEYKGLSTIVKEEEQNDEIPF